MRSTCLSTAVAVAAVLLAACGSGYVERYPEEVVRNFMAACQKRSEESVCRCAIDHLQRHLTLAEFSAAEARAARGEVPKEMIEPVEACAR
jgi:hypothetical protein